MPRGVAKTPSNSSVKRTSSASSRNTNSKTLSKTGSDKSLTVSEVTRRPRRQSNAHGLASSSHHSSAPQLLQDDDNMSIGLMSVSSSKSKTEFRKSIQQKMAMKKQQSERGVNWTATRRGSGSSSTTLTNSKKSFPHTDPFAEQEARANTKLQSAREKIQEMFLEQRQKEQAARKDHSDRGGLYNDSSDSAADEEELNLHETMSGAKAQRRLQAFEWYRTLGVPDKETMKRLVVKQRKCPCTPDDVDSLPWVKGDLIVNVPEMMKWIKENEKLLSTTPSGSSKKSSRKSSSKKSQSVETNHVDDDDDTMWNPQPKNDPQDLRALPSAKKKTDLMSLVASTPKKKKKSSAASSSTDKKKLKNTKSERSMKKSKSDKSLKDKKAPKKSKSSGDVTTLKKSKSDRSLQKVDGNKNVSEKPPKDSKKKKSSSKSKKDESLKKSKKSPKRSKSAANPKRPDSSSSSLVTVSTHDESLSGRSEARLQAVA